MDAMALYDEIVQCPLHCAGITNDPSRGHIPRSFYWGDEPRANVLIVSKNPGTAPPWEAQRYVDSSPNQWVQVHLDLTRQVFGGGLSVGSSYHVNLVRRVAAVLGCEPTADAVFRQAAMTALAKCQSAAAKTDKLTGTTLDTCSARYLFREIELFRPVYLLALGTEVFNYLSRPDIAARHRLAVGKLWHPSWTNMPGGEATYFRVELPRLRREYFDAMSRAGR